MAYVMPLSAGDIALNERFHTFQHTSGIQGKGRDIGARRHNAGPLGWTQLDADDASVLSNWIIYGTPFYAMAAGTVVGAWRNAPNNAPGSLHADYVAERFAGGGNHLWILQDDGVYALYAHAKPGSIPSALCPYEAKLFAGKRVKSKNPDIDPSVAVTNGARVEAGQFLGLVGNSGASMGGPHLHVHMEKDGKAVSMKFARGLTAHSPSDFGGLDGPWKKVAGNALPIDDIFVWAPRPVGNYTFKGTPSSAFQGWFDHMTDSGMFPNIITCKNNGASYDHTWVPKKGKCICHFGMSAAAAQAKHAEYTQKGYKRTSSYTCGSATVAIWRK